MEPLVAYPRALSRLIYLLRHPGSTMEQVRDALRLLVSHARETAVVFDLYDRRLSIDGSPVVAPGSVDELVGQLSAHGVRRLAIRQFATAAELIKLTRLLSEPPVAEAVAGTFEQRATALKLWNVQVTSGAIGESDPALVRAAAAVGSSSEPPLLRRHLARVRAAGTLLDATRALDELVTLAEEHAAANRAELVAEVLAGVTRVERETTTLAVREACGRAIDERLARPTLARLVAQLLPASRGRPECDQYVAALGRSGAAGAGALIAHLMAAETFEERRVFFDAIVELRAGIPMLIDALGHPQWYIVRNAACLLGEMRADQADAALVRLLDHNDERVREAAAEALSRLDTPTARQALRRMLQDRSPTVRLHAAGAFAASGQAVTAAPLASALDAESDGEVQLSIIAALGRLGTPDAVQKLVKAVDGPGARAKPVRFRVAALEALAQARGADAVPTLRAFMTNPDDTIRETAKRLIATAALV